MRCPKCYGKIRKYSSKQKGGHNTYRCRSCKRKFILDYSDGRFKQVV